MPNFFTLTASNADAIAYHIERDGVPGISPEALAKFLRGVAVDLREAEKLKSLICEPPAGSHPDEMLPRAKTWHEERQNWFREVGWLRGTLPKTADGVTITLGQNLYAIRVVNETPLVRAVVPCGFVEMTYDDGGTVRDASGDEWHVEYEDCFASQELASSVILGSTPPSEQPEDTERFKSESASPIPEDGRR